MSVTTTGLNPQGIPVGATVTRAYWCSPGHYGPVAGEEHATQAEALRAAIADKEALLAAQEGRQHFIPEAVTVDLRWTMAWNPGPQGGASGTDTVASRTTYDTLAEAREHLARIERFTPAG